MVDQNCRACRESSSVDGCELHATMRPPLSRPETPERERERLIESHARTAALEVQRQGVPDHRLSASEMNQLVNMRHVLKKFAAELVAMVVPPPVRCGRYGRTADADIHYVGTVDNHEFVAPPAEPRPERDATHLPADTEATLRFAFGAVMDAIYLEDGLDGAAGEWVMRIIHDTLVSHGHTAPEWPGDLEARGPGRGGVVPERDALREDLDVWNIHAVEWLSECDPYMKGDERNAHGLITRARQLFAGLFAAAHGAVRPEDTALRVLADEWRAAGTQPTPDAPNATGTADYLRGGQDALLRCADDLDAALAASRGEAKE